MINLVPNQFSFYHPPIKNVDPTSIVNIETVATRVRNDSLELWTSKVRSGECSKLNVLPAITPSGVFKKRNEKDIISFSGIICIDFDDVDIKLKSKLFEDTFINPSLIFISPRGAGLKLLITIRDAQSDLFLNYFKAFVCYYKTAFNLVPDKSCKDISRACLLCHDENVLLNSKGSVSSDDILRFYNEKRVSKKAPSFHYKN